MNFPVICLCGSCKFRDSFHEYARNLTMCGGIVLMPHVFGPVSAGAGKMLDKMHFAEIDMSDIVFIINKNNYIGLSTRDEIAYAIAKEKPLVFAYALLDTQRDEMKKLCNQQWENHSTMKIDFTMTSETGLLAFFPKSFRIAPNANFWLDVMNIL